MTFFFHTCTFICNFSFQKFASDGLRTLCLAYKDLTAAQFDAWKESHQQAALSLVDREDKLDEVYNEIEKDLVLLGATAIEDKLQVLIATYRAIIGIQSFVSSML